MRKRCVQCRNDRRVVCRGLGMRSRNLYNRSFRHTIRPSISSVTSLPRSPTKMRWSAGRGEEQVYGHAFTSVVREIYIYIYLDVYISIYIYVIHICENNVHTQPLSVKSLFSLSPMQATIPGSHSDRLSSIHVFPAAWRTSDLSTFSFFLPVQRARYNGYYEHIDARNARRVACHHKGVYTRG